MGHESSQEKHAKLRKEIMKNLTTALLLLLITPLTARAEKFQISPTLSLETAIPVVAKEMLFSLHSELVHLKYKDQNVELMVTRNSAPTLANRASVERYWKEARHQTSSFDKNETDKGCKRLNARLYRCHRSVGQNGKYIAETLYWNAKNDLLLLRVSSKRTLSEASEVSNSFQVQADSRLPAGGK